MSNPSERNVHAVPSIDVVLSVDPLLDFAADPLLNPGERNVPATHSIDDDGVVEPVRPGSRMTIANLPPDRQPQFEEITGFRLIASQGRTWLELTGPRAALFLIPVRTACAESRRVEVRPEAGDTARVTVPYGDVTIEVTLWEPILCLRQARMLTGNANGPLPELETEPAATPRFEASVESALRAAYSWRVTYPPGGLTSDLARVPIPEPIPESIDAVRQVVLPD